MSDNLLYLTLGLSILVETLRADGLKMEVSSLCEYIEKEAGNIDREIGRLVEESRRLYRADGTFSLLSTPEEAVKARIACAQMIEQFQSDNQPRS